ncbi:MAG: redoxin domain-containing protein [Geobacteraceae bacterium]|nr:redoxin domain-containing protein [Geobacteraceae bacterium]
MFFTKMALFAALLFSITACGDNLFPSGSDKRAPVVSGSTGSAVGQNAADFSVSDINNSTVTLASSLSGRKGAVFYFTMWCPICDGHMSSLRSAVAPGFPDVGFYLVDYVSGTVTDAASAAAANGYSGGMFAILADTSHSLQNSFQATMGTTVLVDKSGIIKMNEDYRDGTRLLAELNRL